MVCWSGFFRAALDLRYLTVICIPAALTRPSDLPHYWCPSVVMNLAPTLKPDYFCAVSNLLATSAS
jgi:hypothetical protein